MLFIVTTIRKKKKKSQQDAPSRRSQKKSKFKTEQIEPNFFYIYIIFKYKLQFPISKFKI